MNTPYFDPERGWCIDDVPIIETGVEYDLGSGLTTFTEEDLIDAVQAYTDPTTVAPRLKLGHSAEWNNVVMADGEPAFGKAVNLRLANKGQAIIADYIGMPEWLAKIAPVAYPSRSIDGRRNAKMANGRNYKLLITAVSNLGVRWPGCQSLEDLPLWFGDEIPEGAEFDIDAEAVEAGGGMRLGRKKDKEKIEAAVDVDLVRRKFNSDVAVGENYWMWIRGVKLDDGFLIVENEQEGSLWRYPVEISADGDIEFGDPVEVTEEFPDKAVAASAIIAGMAMSDPDMVVYASRAESRPEENHQEGATGMDEATRAALASQLGLSDDATEDDISAEITRLRSAAPAGEGAPDTSRTNEAGQQGAAPLAPAADEHGTTGPNQGERPAQYPPVGAGPVTPPPDGEMEAGKGDVIQLDRATFEQLKRGSDLAVQQAEKARNAEITACVNDAISVGRIPPARRQHWEKALAADFEGNKAVLESLEAGLVPVSARGASGQGQEGEEIAAGANDGFPDDWFPEIPSLRERAAQGRPVTMAKEG